MDWVNWKDKAAQLITQYKYVALVLIIGVALMLMPGKRSNAELQISETPSTPKLSIQDQLEQILGQIQGVGKVNVLLTVSSGEKTLYETNEDRSDSADTYTQRQETVLITGEDRAQQGLIRQVIPPVYQGAIVVCQGGDIPTIQLAIVEAVADATGLTADKISVLKMK